MLSNKTARLEKSINNKEGRLCSLSDKKGQLEDTCVDSEDKTQAMIELQIETTKLNIQLVDLRSEVIMEKNKLKSARFELRIRGDVLCKKRNFLVIGFRLYIFSLL